MAANEATTGAQALSHEVQDQLLRLQSKLRGALALLDDSELDDDADAAAMLIVDAMDSVDQLRGAPAR
jgi:hypothetical protein